jgi:hypothetical protein
MSADDFSLRLPCHTSAFGTHMRLQAEHRHPICVAGKRREGALVAMIADGRNMRRSRGSQAQEKCNGLSRPVALTALATKTPLQKHSPATSISQFPHTRTSALGHALDKHRRGAIFLFATAKSLDSMRKISMGMNVHSPE